jgi:hypothetical protein
VAENHRERDHLIQTVANALGFKPDLRKIHAAVLFYFTLSEWKNPRSLRAAVKTASQDMRCCEILKLSAIADLPDYEHFRETNSDDIKTLGAKLIRCS